MSFITIETKFLRGNDFSKLIKRLIADIKTGQTKMANKAKEIVKERIESDIYGVVHGGSPYYVNTKGLVNAWTLDKGDNGFVIYMDPAKVPAIGPYGQISTHKTMLGSYIGVRGQDFRNGILQSYESGARGTRFNGYAGIPATRYWTNIFNDLEREMIVVLAEHLSAKGWSVSIV